MAKTKQQSSSASQRRQEVKKQRQQRLSTGQRNQSQSRNQNRRRGKPEQSPWGLIVGVILVIAAVIGIFIYLSHQSTSNSSGTTARAPVSSSVLDEVTHVSPTVLAGVGTGGQQNLLVSLKGGSTPPLIGPTGKPEFLYMGAEYCPYCAAERWAVVVALSRFGTFSKLNQTTSSATDVYPSTPTFSFYQSSYTSQYIDFVSVEETSNQPDSSGGYTTLQTPTTDQQNTFNKYDAPPYLSSAGSIPFIDIGNRYATQGANYSPQVLSGLNWQDIAHDLSSPNSEVTQGIVGTANYLTAAICLATKQQPASVCKVDPIPTIEQTLNKAAFNGGRTQVGIVPGQLDMMARRQD